MSFKPPIRQRQLSFPPPTLNTQLPFKLEEEEDDEDAEEKKESQTMNGIDHSH